MNIKTRKSISILCAYLLLLLPYSVYGEPSYQKDTVIFYGNGVMADEYGAEASKRALEKKVVRELGNPDIESQLFFDVAYNRTHELTHGLLDFAEAFVQYYQGFQVHFWHWLAGIDSLPVFTQIELSLIAELLDKASIVSNDNVQEHVDMYNQLLLECKRVVVVAHSQGNFYANIAVGGIEPDLADSFRVVSVANPASFVAGYGPHTTIEEDFLIARIPGSMPANIDNYGVGESYSPWLGHYFVENYLSLNHPAEDNIVNDTVQEILQLREVDNNNHCGWPAVWGNSIALFREPLDFFSSADTGNISHTFWGLVWPAVLNNTLMVEYRLGTSGTWIQLPQDTIREGGAWASYERPLVPPYVFINNNYAVLGTDLSGTVEVQPDDVGLRDPKGIQQYRLSIDGKVIDQFIVDYHVSPWSPVRASGPIREPLREGSYPIQEITGQ